MNFKEAIDHCYEVSRDEETCEACRQEHLQLAHWLEELQDFRELHRLQISFGERYLTAEENQRKLDMYREMSSEVAGYEFLVGED